MCVCLSREEVAVVHMAGRSEEEWERRRAIATEFLIQRAQLGKVTSYSELEDAIVRRGRFEPLSFDLVDHRQAMADMLGAVSAQSQIERGVMLSALVIYLNENEPGPGFYRAAKSIGVLGANASRAACEAFWLREVGRVHAAFGPRHART